LPKFPLPIDGYKIFLALKNILLPSMELEKLSLFMRIVKSNSTGPSR
jgi:hypothetical protein